MARGLPAGLGAAARRWELARSRPASPRDKAERGSRAAPLCQTRVPRGAGQFLPGCEVWSGEGG